MEGRTGYEEAVDYRLFHLDAFEELRNHCTLLEILRRLKGAGTLLNAL